MNTERIHIDKVRPGDTILHNNIPTTVCSKDIRYDNFIGTTLFGDSYHSGYKKVILLKEL